ncbi:uncharacterized protein LOC114732215 [Neltuma alba]|uniref:uncharacterized protein LOC114732215 n=1 Tax=Neltuma alba TaxID=207710 RepID=UPI0010A32EB6|nr:uncharacterized protein LOC114732215 [Prosopis alba]
MGLEEKHAVALIGGLCQWDQQLNQEKNLIEQDQQLNQEKNLIEQDRQLKSKVQEEPPASRQEGNTVDRETQDSYKFGNSYFRGLLEREPDNPLLKREGFRKWVAKYAQSEAVFLTYYAEAHEKVLELGVKAATSGKAGSQTDQKSPPTGTNRARLVQGIGIAVVATAIIIGFFLSRRSK